MSVPSVLNPIEKVHESVILFVLSKITHEEYLGALGQIRRSLDRAIQSLQEVEVHEALTQGKALQDVALQGFGHLGVALDELLALPVGCTAEDAKDPLERATQAWEILQAALKAIQAQRIG